jgi:hypothetical protein
MKMSKILKTKQAEEGFSAALVVLLLLILSMLGAVALLVGSAVGLVAYTVLLRERLCRRAWLKPILLLAVTAVVAGAIAATLSRVH